MKEWTFRVFWDDGKVSDFLEWRKRLPHRARAKLDKIITYMEITKDWTNTKYFRPLSGYEGIAEIRFFINNKQYRPLGCYGPKKGEFTLLVGAEEKGNRFRPLSAPETAKRRRLLVLREGERYTDEY